MVLHLPFLIAALVVFLLAAFVPWQTRVNMIAVGLALLTLAFIFVR